MGLMCKTRAGYVCSIQQLATDVHDATGEDRSAIVLHDSQGGLARKERVLLGSPPPMYKKKRIYRADILGCNPIKVHS